MKLKSMVIGALGLSLSVVATQTSALDKENYLRLANATISEANGGFITNVNQLIAIQEKLVQLGVDGSNDYIKRHPEHADILGEVVKNADNMKNMTLDEIEAKWHSGEHMRAAGFDLDKLGHFGELYSLMDSIIHPATSYIALQEYKRTRKADLLARASAELIEVVEHVNHVGEPGTTLLTEK